jgi:MFS family permease
MPSASGSRAVGRRTPSALAAKARALRHHTMLPVIWSSTVGTAIEWYDFFLYGFLAVSVFPTAFFLGLDPFTGSFAAFSTNFAGFLARPLGGAFFGWFGDRIGRKATLVATLLLMGAATVLIGVVPGYAGIGIAAPITLAALRFAQGFGIGGEWGGSVLLSMEFGDERRRGFWASWPQTGVPIGLALSALAMIVYQRLFPGDAFASVGWRIPMLQSSVLLIVGLYIRMRIPETPVFARIQRERHIAARPTIEVLRHHWSEVLLCALLRSGETAPFYIFTTFVVTYGVQRLALPPNMIYAELILAGIVCLGAMPTFALLSDRVGRKRWYSLGTILMATFAVPAFRLLDTRAPALTSLAIVFAVGICVSWLYGPQAALIAERFGPRLRYSGASLDYQLASITAGGPAPIIATTVLAQRDASVGGTRLGASPGLLIAAYLIVMSLMSLVSVQFLREYTGRSAAGDVTVAADSAERRRG